MGANAKVLSCRPCRERKVRCDRATPCRSCIRHGCTAECQPHRVQKASHQRVAIPRLTNAGTATNQWRADQTGQSPFDSAEGPRVEYGSMQDLIYPTPNSQYRAPLEPLPSAALSTDYPTDCLSSIERLHDHIRLESLKWNVDASPKIPAFSGLGAGLTQSEVLSWKIYLASCLPTRLQCDVLTAYFFENIQWIYQAIHVPSFREDEQHLWTRSVADVNLIWLALYYVTMSLSALYIDVDLCETVCLGSVRKNAHVWFRLSRQSLQAGEYDSKPCLTQILVFLESQLYWYATKGVESLNSALGQAVRCAQALSLDRDKEPSTNLATELRHRLWWDLCSADTFQSLCLDRQPLLQSYLSHVPFPLNCNDSDFTSTRIHTHAIEEPTPMTMHVFRAKTFKILNELYAENGAHLLSYERVSAVDAEVLSLTDQFPWFMNMAKSPFAATTANPEFDYVRYQHHLLQSSICMQRIRMYRPFLKSPHHEDCWPKCISAIENIFSVYHAIRAAHGASFHRSQKRLAQSYQIFCAAVSVAVFVLVEKPSTLRDGMQRDIEIVIEDLARLTEENQSTPLASEGRATLKKLLELCRYTPEPEGSEGNGNASSESWQALVSELYAYMGGRNRTKAYLDSRTLRANDAQRHQTSVQAVQQQPQAGELTNLFPTTTTTTNDASVYDFYKDSSAFDVTMHFDMLSWGIDDLVPME